MPPTVSGEQELVGAARRGDESAFSQLVGPHRAELHASLDLLGKRPQRVLPMDVGPRTHPEDGPGAPILESVWLEPYADAQLAAAAARVSPDAL